MVWKKSEETEEVVHEPVDLPELDKEELHDETLSALETEEVQLTESEVVEATPEYDSGFVEVEDLLDDEMQSNYELNTVEETEFDDMLEGAEIIGDLPSEIDFESD